MKSKSESQQSSLQCRLGCGACCIVPSISSPIPGMPEGKPAGQRCVQLNEQNLCNLFGKPERPPVCLQFQAHIDSCGRNNSEAFLILTELEFLTQ